jgi:hypothetical protein
LTGRKLTEFGDPQLDDESATGDEVACGIAEAGDLLALGQQVGDGVEGEVDRAGIAAF